jgi:uncharacterized protein (DUF488 family)
MASTQLFTIGYEGMDLQSFMSRLEDKGIDCVLDVRENPFSRKPGFSKGPLSRALEARGIQYVHFKELGTPRSLREQLKADGDHGKFLQEMEKYLTTREEALDHARDYVARMTCCVMCYERSADLCHRKLVAQMVRVRVGDGVCVIHLQHTRV